MPLSHLALLTGARGPAMNCLTACCRITQAIGEATEILRRGDADVMIGGGAHCMIHPFGVTGFNRLTALSTANDNPRCASRPLRQRPRRVRPRRRRGMVILETLDHACPQGADLAGIGRIRITADAFRITDQHPEDSARSWPCRKRCRRGAHPQGHRLYQRPRHRHAGKRR